ncbi:SDR family oxidoreductase [Nocardia sp. NPDC049149]|uniref:SDR family oxidoreductase n=1 Tax=Nocardia sp. NPDC049149 TaxID=3364315 RepID=UPI0037221782
MSTLAFGTSADERPLVLPAATTQYWAGRHVVVTGGSSGIGLAVTESALAAGARVSVVALADAALERLSAAAQATPDVLTVVAADVSNQQQVAAALDRARVANGRIDAVIACAGIAKPNYFESLTDGDFTRHMAVNYFGALHVIRAALPDLKTGERASITVISSMAAVLPCFGYGAYSPSKFAVRALCEVLRQELKPHGITVTVVLPPDVDTPQLAAESATKPPELQALSGSTPITAEQVAQALLVGAARGDASVIPSWNARLLSWFAGFAPGLVARFVDWTIARVQRGQL